MRSISYGELQTRGARIRITGVTVGAQPKKGRVQHDGSGPLCALRPLEIRAAQDEQKSGFEKGGSKKIGTPGHHGVSHGRSLLEVGATEHRLRVMESLNLSPLDNDAA